MYLNKMKIFILKRGQMKIKHTLQLCLILVLTSCTGQQVITNNIEYNNEILSIANKYKVKFVFKNFGDTWNSVSYTELSDDDKLRAARTFDKALWKYPENIFPKIGLRYVVLVDNLRFAGVLMASVPDNYKQALFISFRKEYKEVYMLHVIYHELNHYIEFWIWKDYRYKWKPYSKYYTGSSKGGQVAYKDDEETLNTNYSGTQYNLDGFINLYSTLGQEEDRSEIVAYYFNDKYGEHKALIKKCKMDPIFRKKVELVLGLYEEKLGFKGLLENLAKEIENN